MAIFSGAESVVNLPDGGVQQNARLARGANGGWIAAWQSGEGGTDGFGVFLRLFDAGGLGGPEIHVNQKTAANQGEISVTMLGDGGFLVTWTDMDYAASGEWEIYQRRYDASGTPLTGEMPVNLTTSDMQASPDVIATPDGGWIVAWTSSGQAGPNRDIFMRRFDSTGADMTGEVLVNTSTVDLNDTPKTTLLTSGGWVINWQRVTATGTALFQRQFDSAGIPAGPEVVVDSMPGGQDERPATAGLADGGWIVAWAAFGLDGSGWSICQRRYDAAGNAVPTTLLLVNTHTVDDQRNPAIASLPNGGWVVVWQSENQDDSSFLSSSGIYQQVFDIYGNPVGGEMLVNSQIVGNQANPTVTTLDDGAWIVSWQDDSVGGTDIIQKKFEPIHAAPEGQDKSIDIAAGDSHAFSASDFAFTDGDGDALLSIVMTGFVGNLLLDGQAVAIGATINAADLDKMVWDADGGPGGSISFKVIDSGSTAHGGVNMDDDANTITFNVIASTAAIFGGDLAGTVSEDESTVISGTATVTDPDPGEGIFLAAPAGSLSGTYGAFTFNEANGQWTYDLDLSDAAIQALKAGETITDNLQIASLDGTTAEIVVTIDGVNDAAVLAGDLAAVLGEDESDIIGGTASVVDADSGESAFLAVPAGMLIGAHGAFTFNEASGQWTYDLDESDASIQALKAGETLTDSLQIASLDGTTKQIVVTIDGVNDAAVLAGDLAAVIGEDESGIIGGTASVVDADSGESAFLAAPAGTLLGAHGAFTFNEASGQWTYDLDESDASIQALKAGEALTDSLQIASADGTTAELVVTIDGINDAAVLAGDLAAVLGEDESGISGGTASVVDADSGENLFLAVPAGALIGAHGAFTFNALNGQWTYDLDEADAAIQALKAGETITDGLQISSLDGTTAEIVVTIDGAADGAVAGGALSAVTAEDGFGPVGGAIIVVDPDAGESTIVSMKSGLHGAFSINASTGQWSYDLDNEDDAVQSLGDGDILTDIMQVETVDGTVIDISVSITGTNDSAATGGLAAADVIEDLAVNASGLLTITDPDQGQAGWQSPADLTGDFGTFTFDLASGAWTYALDNARPDIQALGTGQSLVDILTVTSLDGTAQSQITVTIAGADEPPAAAVISGTMAATLSEDTTGTAFGTLAVTDPDAGQEAFAAVPLAQLAGAHGTFTFAENSGQWSYDLDETDVVVQSLKDGETLTDLLAIASVDGTTAQIVVTIQGASDAAVIAGGLAAETGEDHAGILGGTASVVDADAGESAFAPVPAAALAGAHGIFAFNEANGQWSYDLDETDAAIQSLKTGESLADTLQVTSADGTMAAIVVTINGANDIAVVAGAWAMVIGEDEAAAIGGNVSVSDADAGESLFLAAPESALAGDHGIFTFDDASGQWSYDLDEADPAIQSLKAGESLDDTLPITSLDGTTAEIVVTINGVNDAAVIAGDLAADIGEDEATIVGGVLSVSDADAGEGAFLAVPATAGDHGVFTFNALDGQWSYDLDESDAAIQSLKTGETLTDILAIASADGTTADIVVTVNGANDAAVLAGDLAANIGEDESAIIGGTASVSDADTGESLFLPVPAAALAGAHGVFAFDEISGLWSYDLDEADATIQSLKAGETITDTLAIASVDGTTAEIAVTISGANDAAVMTGGLAADIGEDDSAMIGGTASVVDADSGESEFLAVTAASLNGIHGVFTFNEFNGLWSYDPDETDAAIQSLKAGETFTDMLQVTSADGTSAEIVVTINGANDAAVISGDLAADIVEDAATVVGGFLEVSDADSGESVFLAVTAAQLGGAHGAFTFNEINGQWSYDLNEADIDVQGLKAGETLTDTLAIASTDGTTAEIVVTVNGANDAAVLAGNLTADVGEDESGIIGGTASVVDADSGESLFFAAPAGALAGDHGTFTFNEASGAWSYDLDGADASIQALKAGETLGDTLKVTSADGTSAEIVVTINGTNDAAVITGDLAADIGEDEATIVGGVLSVSDADSGESAFLAVTAGALGGAHGAFTYNEVNGQWSYDLDEADLDVQCLKAGETLTDTLSVMTLDGTCATITVHVSGENDAPVIMPALADLVAKAGNIFVFEAGSYVLDVDRDDLAFTATLADGAALPDWLAFDGATGRFSGTPADKDAGAISIVITAADGHGGLAADSFDIVVVAQPSTANHAPFVAAAIADQAAIEDMPFEFALPAGSFKDADGDALELTATLADGSALPDWLAFDPANGRFSGTPLNVDAGKIAILVTASDGTDSVLDVFTLEVANVNDAPTLTQAIADQVGARNSAFSFILPAGLFADIDDADVLSLSATLDNGDPLPGWLAFDAATGGISGVPGVGDTGVHAITVTATDMAGASASAAFNITIADINDAPGGTDTTITFDEGTSYVFSAADFGFGDANGDALKAVMIDAIAGRGALLLDGMALMAGDEIAVADFGKLAFAPGPDDVGADYARISFRVRDDGGTGNGGVDLDPIANIITFAVTDILDVVNGDRYANILNGTEGGDQLSGKGGNDRVNAADGLDRLAGGGGRDRLMGGAGEDVLNGGKGRDRLAGGEGADTFLFRRNGSVDVILDFDAVEDGGHDRLDLAPLKSITGFDDLMKHHVSWLGGDVVIDAGHGDRVILRNVQMSDLDAGDFLF